jgi:hypothetical protein
MAGVSIVYAVNQQILGRATENQQLENCYRENTDHVYVLSYAVHHVKRTANLIYHATQPQTQPPPLFRG